MPEAGGLLAEGRAGSGDLYALRLDDLAV